MKRFAKSSLALMPVVALVVALGACSSSSSSPAATVPADTDLEVRAVSGLQFDKTSYEVATGENFVAYVNEDTIRHNLIVAQGDTKVSGFELVVNKNGDIDTGSITLAGGSYVLLCTVPGHQNMKADLTVK
jgi:plastocyanin